MIKLDVRIIPDSGSTQNTMHTTIEFANLVMLALSRVGLGLPISPFAILFEHTCPSNILRPAHVCVELSVPPGEQRASSRRLDLQKMLRVRSFSFSCNNLISFCSESMLGPPRPVLSMKDGMMRPLLHTWMLISRRVLIIILSNHFV